MQCEYMDGRVRLIAVVLKTTYPEMGTRVQIPIHVSAHIMGHKLASVLSDDAGYK